MAMKNCKSCGKEIAKSAKVCPHCGQRQKMNGCFVIFIIFVIGGLIAIGSCVAVRGSARAEARKRIQFNGVYAIETRSNTFMVSVFENISTKEIIAFKGELEIYDKFGKISNTVSYECPKTIPPKTSIYNCTLNSSNVNIDEWVMNIENKDFIRVYQPENKLSFEKSTFKFTDIILAKK